jgi:long-subunit acyl-CoA synthetase (AMP-forming)
MTTTTTLLHTFLDRASTLGDRPAMVHRRDGAWRSISWAEYGRLTAAAARGLIGLGHRAGEPVAILSQNRFEWLVADVAAQRAAGVPVGVYPSLPPDQVAHVVGHAEASVVIAEDGAQLQKIRAIRAGLPKLRAVVVIDPPSGEALREGELTLEYLIERGTETPAGDTALDERLKQVTPESLCTLIYTSGTTGPPKGVMLTHRNAAAAAGAVVRVVAARDDDVVVSYLPLSHIAERMVSLYACIQAGFTIWFAESMAKVAEAIAEARPTLFFAVPRVWEKMRASVEAKVAAAPPLRKALFGAALESGTRAMHARERRAFAPHWAAAGAAMDRLVGSKLRARLGLDRSRITVSGAAPINPALQEWFGALGLPIVQVYGLSETTGVISLELPEAPRRASVGRPLPGTEVRIAPDGEILSRGAQTFKGYFKEAAATREAIDAEGWFHTGDVGRLDADGYLWITDRKKDLIITAGGKNVAPQNIEKELLGIPGLQQACVLGDRKPHLVALLYAAEKDRAAVETGLAALNGRLASYEQVKKWAWLPQEMTEQGGELTPSLKVKRKAVVEKYAGLIDSMYGAPPPPA